MNFEDYESLPTNNVKSHMLAGAAAGVMEHCVMYPLDSVKTRMQSLTATAQVGRGMGDVFRGMVTQEGVLRPLRGVSAVILGAAPAHALYFSCYEYLKDNFTNRKFINNTVGYGLAGGLATMLHDGIMTPADVVKQRLQMYNSPYRSVFDCLGTVFRQEGWLAFYRSYTTQLAMNVPFQSIHFITYEMAQNLSNPSRTYNPMAHMVSGAISGGVAAAITTPLDVCKTFLNTQQSQEKISGLFNAIRSVYTLGGPLAFFRGLQARVLYQMPSTAICWSTYEFFKYLLTVNALPSTLCDDSLLDVEKDQRLLMSTSDGSSSSSATVMGPIPAGSNTATSRRASDSSLSPPTTHVPDAKSFNVTKFTETDSWASAAKAAATASGVPGTTSAVVGAVGSGGRHGYNKPALAFTTVHSGDGTTDLVSSRFLDSSRHLPMDTSFRSF